MEGITSCCTQAPVLSSKLQVPAADVLASCGHTASLTMTALPAVAVLARRSGGVIASIPITPGLAAVLDFDGQEWSRTSSQESTTLAVRAPALGGAVDTVMNRPAQFSKLSGHCSVCKAAHPSAQTSAGAVLLLTLVHVALPRVPQRAPQLRSRC